MNRLTLAIVADTLFGAEVGSASDTARVQQAITDVMEMFDLVLVPFADWLVHLPLPRMRRYRAAQHGARRGDLRHHRRTASTSARTEATCSRCCCTRRTPKARAAAMTDRQLRDEVITLFLAGHETTANALTWTWVLLARHPEAERHLHAEIDAVLRANAAIGRRRLAPALHPRGRCRVDAAVSASLDDGAPRAAWTITGRATTSRPAR